MFELSHFTCMYHNLCQSQITVTWPYPDHAVFRDDLSSAGWDASNYTHYEHMKGGAKCRKWGGLGRLGVTQGHEQCHHSIKRIWLPIWLLRPHWGWPQSNFSRDLWHQKTRLPGLLCGTASTFSRFSSIASRDTNDKLLMEWRIFTVHYKLYSQRQCQM